MTHWYFSSQFFLPFQHLPLAISVIVLKFTTDIKAFDSQRQQQRYLAFSDLSFSPGHSYLDMRFFMPVCFRTMNPKSVGLSSLSVLSAWPRFNKWIKEDNEEWVSWQCPPLTTLTTVAFKWSSSPGLFAETGSQLGGGLWGQSPLNYYISKDEGIEVSKVNDEVGKWGKREPLLSGCPAYRHCFVCFFLIKA